MFWIIAGLTGLCALGVVVTQNIVRSATWLLFALAGTSATYFLLGAEFIAREGPGLEKRVYAVPRHIDEEIAAVKLATLGVEIDALTPDQARYLASWDRGT